MIFQPFEIYLENWIWLDTYLKPNVNFDILIQSRFVDVPKSYSVFSLNISLDKSLATDASLTLIEVSELETKLGYLDRKAASTV